MLVTPSQLLPGLQMSGAVATVNWIGGTGRKAFTIVHFERKLGRRIQNSLFDSAYMFLIAVYTISMRTNTNISNALTFH